MLTRQSLWLVLALLVPGTPAIAEIYKYYDADGNLVLTDTVPKQHAEKLQKVETKPVMTIPALPAAKRAPGAASQKPVVKAGSGEYAIVVQSPAAGATYSLGGGPIPVAVSVSPGLAPGQRLEMRIDDGTLDASITEIALEHLAAGRHTLQVRVVDAKGQEIKQANVTFLIQEASTSGAAAPGDGKPAAP